MKKHTLIFAAAMTALTATAQETYLDGTLLKPQLSGTARYVGMGGAMEALGADLSTIGTNPAGIGLFRHSTANITFGIVSQQDAPSFEGVDKTHASFDQVGFVYSMRTARNSYLNFAFNYTKDRDFNQLINPQGSTYGSSQGEATAAKALDRVFDYDVRKDEIVSNSLKFTQLDYLYSNLMNYAEDEQGGYWRNFPKQAYDMRQRQWGYVGKYELNISGNIKDRVYLGATVGIHDVHFNSVADYAELASDGESYINVIDENQITGNGFDVKAGIIFRPVEESPFRIGLSVATPTFYDLKLSNYTSLDFLENVENEKGGIDTYTGNGEVGYDYNFRLNSPWRFGASLGHTVGSMLAVGVSYEFADYGKTDNREIDGYDYYGYETSSSDKAMNHHTDKTLKAVSTLKVGAEFRPDPMLAVRLGFNYVSPMYEENGYKPGDINSVGNAISGTAYTNWDATYRVTAGLGYRIDKFNIDLAYQYNTTNGTFSPYASTYVSKAPETAKVSDKRHQLMLTLGYTF